jgi:hypothetical protein
VIEKDSRRFPQTGGWGYAVFNHDVATGKMTADSATADCGHVCHVAVKSKDYIFHPYQTRRRIMAHTKAFSQRRRRECANRPTSSYECTRLRQCLHKRGHVEQVIAISPPRHRRT